MMVYTICKLVKIYCYSVAYAAVDAFRRLLVGRTVKLTAFTFFSFNLQQNHNIFHYRDMKLLIPSVMDRFSSSCPTLMSIEQYK